MLVHKHDKSLLSRSNNPDDNYLNDDNYYVVPDGSELADRIISAYPHFDFAVEGSELVGIVELEKPPLPSPEPTEIELLQEYVVDVDYRVAMTELGF